MICFYYYIVEFYIIDIKQIDEIDMCIFILIYSVFIVYTFNYIIILLIYNE